MLPVEAHYGAVHVVYDSYRHQHQIDSDMQRGQVAQCRIMFHRTRRTIKPGLLGGSTGGLTIQDRAQRLRNQQYRGEQMSSAVQPKIEEHAKDPSAACADSSTTVLG